MSINYGTTFYDRLLFEFKTAEGEEFIVIRSGLYLDILSIGIDSYKIEKRIQVVENLWT